MSSKISDQAIIDGEHDCREHFDDADKDDYSYNIEAESLFVSVDCPVCGRTVDQVWKLHDYHVESQDEDAPTNWLSPDGDWLADAWTYI